MPAGWMRLSVRKESLNFNFLTVGPLSGTMKETPGAVCSNARSYAVPYGRLLAMKLLKEYPEGFDLLTWVPVSRLRKFRRGYDQVELLAGAVGEELGMKPVSLLAKTRHNRKQSGIVGYSRRRANVLGVYKCVDQTAVEGKRILLLDDILTTGATAGECARILLTAGASEVHCAVIAAARKNK